MVAWPTRGQKSPNFWDIQLKTYVDDADADATAAATAAAAVAAAAAGSTAYATKATQTTVESGRLSDASLSAAYISRPLAPSGDAATQIAAVYAQGFTEVELGPGAFTTTGTVIVPTGKTLTLKSGATLTRSSAVDSACVSVLGTLRGGTVTAAATSTYAISIGADNAVVDGVTITAVYGYGIGCGGWDDLRVTNNRFLNCLSYGLLCEGAAKRPIFSGNRVINATTGQGAMFKDGPTDGIMADNIIDVVGTVGLEVFGDTTLRCSVTGNVVRGPNIGISLAAACGSTVTGNTLSGCTTYAIEVAEGGDGNAVTGNAITGGGSGIVVTTSNEVTKPLRYNAVSNNVIRDCGSYGIQTEYGKNMSIVGNLIVNPGERAIFCNNVAVAFTIANNTIVRTAAGAVNSGGIFVTGSDHKIIGNLIDCSASATALGYAIHIAGASRSHIASNTVDKAVKAIALINASNCYLTDNCTRQSSEHAVYGTGGTNVVVDGHFFHVDGGAGVDPYAIGGSVIVHNVWNSNTGTWSA